jgi:hypothetical protein
VGFASNEHNAIKTPNLELFSRLTTTKYAENATQVILTNHWALHTSIKE